MTGNASGLGLADDRSRRCSDVITLHLIAHSHDAWGKWAAIRLSDGSSDGNLYPLKADAVRHQLHPKQCAYVYIPPDGMSPRQAFTYLRFIEQLYDAGADLADPDTQVQMPQNPAHAGQVVRAVKKGRIR